MKQCKDGEKPDYHVLEITVKGEIVYRRESLKPLNAEDVEVRAFGERYEKSLSEERA